MMTVKDKAEWDAMPASLKKLWKDYQAASRSAEAAGNIAFHMKKMLFEADALYQKERANSKKLYARLESAFEKRRAQTKGKKP